MCKCVSVESALMMPIQEECPSSTFMPQNVANRSLSDVIIFLNLEAAIR